MEMAVPSVTSHHGHCQAGQKGLEPLDSHHSTLKDCSLSQALVVALHRHWHAWGRFCLSEYFWEYIFSLNEEKPCLVRMQVCSARSVTQTMFYVQCKYVDQNLPTMPCSCSQCQGQSWRSLSSRSLEPQIFIYPQIILNFFFFLSKSSMSLKQL